MRTSDEIARLLKKHVLLAKGTVKEIKGRIMKVTGHNYGVMSKSAMKLKE